MGKTTLKLVDLAYGPQRTAFATPPATYTECKGLLKGFAMTQDDADAKDIENEFSPSPWDILYTGKPLKMAFSLVNFTLAELPPLIGGTYTAATYVQVLTVSDTAPAVAAIGDKYVGQTAKKLFTATAANTFDAGVALVSNTAYKSIADGKLYVYDGTTVTISTTDMYNEKYQDAEDVVSFNYEWKVGFGRGFKSFVLYNGLTVGKMEKTADGALAIPMTVTGLQLKIGDEVHRCLING